VASRGRLMFTCTLKLFQQSRVELNKNLVNKL
jgi:hypothetical protein